MDIKIEVTLPNDVPVHPWSSQVKPEEHQGEVFQGPGKAELWRNFLSRGEWTNSSGVPTPKQRAGTIGNSGVLN